MEATELRSPPDVAPPDAPAGLRRARTVVARVPPIVWIVAIALLAALLMRPYPSYDHAYALSAMQDVLDGRTPAYEALYPETPLAHPLVLLAALGAGIVRELTSIQLAFYAFGGLALLAFGLLVWSMFEIGRRIHSWPVGLLAAALTFTSVEAFRHAIRTTGDGVAAAFVAWALLMVVREPRRGWPVLAALGVAGLLRPESWVLAGLYWLWLLPDRGWRDRALLAALVAAAPLAWMLEGILLNGDPGYARTLSDAFQGRHRDGIALSDAPETVAEFLSAITRYPWMLAAAGAGIVLTALHGRRPGRPWPLICLVLTIVVPTAIAVAGDTMIYQRFYAFPGLLLLFFAAVAALGWIGVRGRARWPWLGVGIAVIVLMAVDAPQWVSMLDARVATETRVVKITREGQAVLSTPAARRALGTRTCLPIYASNDSLAPYIRFWFQLGAPDAQNYFTDLPGRQGPRFIATEAGTVLVSWPTAFGDPRRARRNRALLADRAFRAGFAPIARYGKRHVLYADAACRRALAPATPR